LKRIQIGGVIADGAEVVFWFFGYKSGCLKRILKPITVLERSFKEPSDFTLFKMAEESKMVN
jgi:hypothetical protein